MSQEWTIKELRDKVEKRFKKHPCWYQIKVALMLALHAGKDVITCTATGSGKTLSFWIALQMAMEEGCSTCFFFFVCDEVMQDVDKGHNISASGSGCHYMSPVLSY